MNETYSKSGDPILRVCERLLCSQVDPVKEGNRWIEGHHQILTAGMAVIVLGLGAGYHIAAIRRKHPNLRIAVFEAHPRCIQFAQQQFPIELFEVPILKSEETTSIFKNIDLRKIVGGQFRILTHLPSVAIDPLWYERMRGILLGRTTEGLRYQIGLVPGFSKLSPKLALQPQEDSIDWRVFDRLSGNDLGLVPDREFFLMRALRELIK
jgi:hypothetical protein